MSIREVIYYQAQCDICGTVDDGGDFSAWSEADFARMAATDSGWNEIVVRVPTTATGPAVYIVQREGVPAYKERSILICDAHAGDGIQWCARCEDDLDEARWATAVQGEMITQACLNRHLNVIDLAPDHPIGGQREHEG